MGPVEVGFYATIDVIDEHLTAAFDVHMKANVSRSVQSWVIPGEITVDDIRITHVCSVTLYSCGRCVANTIVFRDKEKAAIETLKPHIDMDRMRKLAIDAFEKQTA